MQNLKMLCQVALISHGVSLQLTRLSQRNTNLRLEKTLHRQLSTNLGPFPVFYFKYAFLWWHIKNLLIVTLSACLSTDEPYIGLL